MGSACEFLLELRNHGIHSLLKAYKGLGDGAVEGDHRTGAVGLRTYGSELETVSCEGKGRGAVTVGVVDEQFRNLRDIHLQALLASHSEHVIHVGLLDVVEQFRNLLAEERTDDGRRRLVGTQTMSVGSTHDRGFQQSVVLIDTHQRLYDERGEAQVLLSGLTRSVQQDTVVRRERPVVVLTATVDACEGLLMQQHAEAVLTGHTLHHRHQQHVVVYGEVRLFENRCQLKLVGGHLVVTGLAGDAQFQRLNLQFTHEGRHTLRDGAEVVVVHLLVLRRVVSHQRAPCQQQVRTGSVETFVHEEVLLFPAEVRGHLLHAGVKVMANLCSSHVHGMQGAEQRSLVVECLAAIRDEDGRDAQRVVDDEHRRCGIPGRVAAGLEGRADATRGER